MQIHTLALGGVNLYYETRGAGPTLLLIAGGSTDADIFAGMADLLAERYRVVTYDPRGNSRSPLSGIPGDIHIEQLADDAYALLGAVTDAPALVFGSSSGAITGLDLLTRYPDAVARLVAHEPPLFRVLPDRDHWDKELQEAVDLYRHEGVAAGMARFGALMGFGGGPVPEQETPAELPEFARRMAANAELFLAHEVLPFTRYAPDLEALGRRRERLMLAMGADSRDLPPALPARWLGEHLDLPVATFPGNHVGYAISPQDFARRLQEQFSAG